MVPQRHPRYEVTSERAPIRAPLLGPYPGPYLPHEACFDGYEPEDILRNA